MIVSVSHLCHFTYLVKSKNKKENKDQDTNGKVTTSQLDITNESQEVISFPAGDHNVSIDKCAQKHNKNKSFNFMKIIIL